MRSIRKSTIGIESLLSNGGRVLVTRLQYLGDVILTLPLVKVLKDRFPNAEIDYLSKKPGAEILKGEKIFTKVFELPNRGIIPTMNLIRGLQRRKYALSIDLLSTPRSAILTFLSGASARIGGTKRVRKHLYSIKVEVEEEVPSACAYHLHYLRPLGIFAEERKPELFISKEEKKQAAEFLSVLGSITRISPRGRLSIAVHPGGKWEVKRWPVENFAELCRRLTRDVGADIYILSAPGEEVFSRKLSSLLNGEAVLIPVLSVRDTASIITQMDYYIGGDGGMTHVAVALDISTLCIVGSSQSDIWFPYERYGPFFAVQEEIECRPCHTHTCSHLSCLRKLSMEKVYEMALKMMKGSRKKGVLHEG